ncbi:MAG: hypothetical protein MK209_06610, partial [Planctomycetes bacterium]|nr:hypothetical protein [Planctomycetota bacterium]
MVVIVIVGILMAAL